MSSSVKWETHWPTARARKDPTKDSVDGWLVLLRKFVLLLPLIYIVPRLANDPTIGVYMAEPIADVTAVTFTTILFIFQFKKALRKIEEKTEE